MKMLLIDDDAFTRAALIAIFGPPAGWEIIEAEDGQQGLDLLHKGLKPDFCVVDLLMPNLGGMEFLEMVRKDPYLRPLKVVATSSRSDRSTIVRVAKLQVSGYLLKPYDPAKTRATLMALVSANPGVENAVRKPSRHTLLAVDDDPVMRAVLTKYMAAMPHWDVKFAVDGDDAFECLYGGLRPDLILTDLHMPNVDGLALIRRIRKDRNFEQTKVAVITGDKNPQRAEELAGLDLVEFMVKPIDQGQMTSLLGRIASEQV